MNQIKVGKLVLAAFITLVIAVAMEVLVESMIGRNLAAGRFVEAWALSLDLPNWSWVLTTSISFVNCLWMMWLYAALRPMFGVGVRTALLTSAFALVFIAAFAVNFAVMGLLPIQVALTEIVYELVELPVAVAAGARVYETS